MKQFRYILIFAAISLLMTNLANAQNLKKYYFTGLARVEMKNNAANGEVYKDDTVSANRTVSGLTVFDLGVHIQPVDYFKVTSIVRLQNQFGVFFGQGSAVALRQLKVEGLIADRVKYEVGDIDLGMTAFTLYNHQDTTFFESPLFSLRRKISNYENLNETSDWRVQGAKAKSVLLWGDSSALRSDLEVFGARNREAYSTIGNRFLTGASVKNKFKGQSFGLNYVRFFEQKSMVSQVASYSNDVMSATLALKKSEDNYSFAWNTEAGISVFNKALSDTLKRKVNDGFVLTGLKGELKKLGLQVGVKYRYVGADFYSAAAQTLRIDNILPSNLFPIQSQGILRTQMLFDRYSATNVYNGSISPMLMMYLPQYGNVLPYGDATPNRQGISSSASYKSKHDVLRIEVENYFLSEVSGSYNRSFVQHKMGYLLRLDSMLGLKKTLELCGSFRNELTKSKGSSTIDFNTSLFDLGLNAEIFNNFKVMMAWKLLNVEGKENITHYYTLNTVAIESNTNFDEQQQWIAWGLQYDFSPKSFFTIHGNYALHQNSLAKATDYSINQYYINYTLRF